MLNQLNFIVVLFNNRKYNVERSIFNEYLKLKNEKIKLNVTSSEKLPTVRYTRSLLRTIHNRKKIIRIYGGSNVLLQRYERKINAHRFYVQSFKVRSLPCPGDKPLGTSLFLSGNNKTNYLAAKKLSNRIGYFGSRKSRSLLMRRFLSFRKNLVRPPLLVIEKFRNLRYQRQRFRLSLRKRFAVLGRRLGEYHIKYSDLWKFMKRVRLKNIRRRRNAMFSILRAYRKNMRNVSNTFNSNLGISHEVQTKNRRGIKLGGMRVFRTSITSNKLANDCVPNKLILPNKSSVRNLFFMIRRKYAGHYYFYDKRYSSVKPIVRSLRMRFRRFGLSKRFVIRTSKRIARKTSVVLKVTRNNTFFSINYGRRLLFKITRGLALRSMQRLDAISSGAPKRVPRGYHDRASKKERRSFVGKHAFNNLLLRYFQKYPLQGAVNFYFYGRVPFGFYKSTFKFFDRIISNSYRGQRVWVERVIQRQRVKLQKLKYIYELLRRNLSLMRSLRKTSVGRAFLKRYWKTFKLYNIFQSHIPYKKAKHARLFGRVTKRRRFRHQVQYAYRGVRWRFRNILRNRAKFLRLNCFYFSTPLPHAGPFKIKKSRRV